MLAAIVETPPHLIYLMSLSLVCSRNVLYPFIRLGFQITGGITNIIFKARNAVTGEGALVRVYGKDTDLLLDRRCGAGRQTLKMSFDWV